jgi:ATP-binding cassette subfamily C protein LapB
MSAVEKAPGHEDSLLAALVYLTAHFGHAKSAEALSAGLPVGKDGMSPTLLCTAAERTGLKARIVKRDVRNIPLEVLPAVVLLKPKTAVILLEKSGDTLRILNPVTRKEEFVAANDLSSASTGHAVYIKPGHEKIADAPDWHSHWFWRSMFDNRHIYTKVMIASFLINCFALTGPVYIMNFYNRVLPNDAVETGWVLSIGALSVFIFDFVIKTLRSYFIDIAGRRADITVAQKLYDQILDMRLGARHGSIGSFANSLREFDSLREFFNSATVTAVVDFPFSLLFIAAIWVIGGPEVAILLLALYGIVMLAAWAIQIPVRHRVRQAMKTAEQKHGLLVETIGSLETIRGVGGEGHLRALHSRITAKSAEAGQDSRFYSGLAVNMSAFIQSASSVFIVLLGMYMIRDQEMTVGALIACVLLSSRAIAPIGMAAALVNKYHQAQSAFKTLNGIMNLPVERPLDRDFLHRPVLTGAMEFRNVGFSYPQAKTSVLDNITFSIRPGEKVAIVGRIGSGKTTLVKLMVNFFETTAGTIMIDGADLRQIDPADLRRNIAYMGQDTTLMSGSLRDNIAMGRPHATDAEVLKAAELAAANDFIRRHPAGYDAPVGERGEGLSGGQRQSIALARTLLMDAPVFIMDEPTNSMDAGTEELVLRNLETCLAQKTAIFVTHKPALLRLVTRLIVLDGGKIVADGPRDQVLQAIAAGQIAAVK